MLIEIHAMAPESLPLPTQSLKWWLVEDAENTIQIEADEDSLRDFLADHWGVEDAESLSAYEQYARDRERRREAREVKYLLDRYKPGTLMDMESTASYTGVYRKNEDGTWDQIRAPYAPLITKMDAEHIGFCVGKLTVLKAIHKGPRVGEDPAEDHTGGGVMREVLGSDNVDRILAARKMLLAISLTAALEHRGDDHMQRNFGRLGHAIDVAEEALFDVLNCAASYCNDTDAKEALR